MKRALFSLILFAAFFLALVFPVKAAEQAPITERYATCDSCGYCVIGQTPAQWANPPTSWESCRACLYPNASSDPKHGDTLRIDPATNQIEPVAKGRMYTMIGCIKTTLDDFTQEGAATSFVQKILDLLFSATGVIAFLYLIYGAFIIITSQADPERLAYGKRVVMGAIIGVIFVTASVFVVNFISSGVLKLPAFSGPPSP